jgi:hypothetical protein
LGSKKTSAFFVLRKFPSPPPEETQKSPKPVLSRDTYFQFATSDREDIHTKQNFQTDFIMATMAKKCLILFGWLATGMVVTPVMSIDVRNGGMIRFVLARLGSSYSLLDDSAYLCFVFCVVLLRASMLLLLILSNNHLVRTGGDWGATAGNECCCSERRRCE